MTELKPNLAKILQLIADGADTEEIAAELHLTAHTVKKRRHEICESLGADNTPQAVAMAMRRHIIT